MFNVQNWDSSPQNSALQTLQHQLVNIKKSLKHYDASPGAKKDSYLLVEFGKVQKLAYIVKDNLKLLEENPKNQQALDYLVHGNVSQLSSVKDGMKLFTLLENTIDLRIGRTENDYESETEKVKDPKFKEFLLEAKALASDETNIYGSRCGLAALKVVDIYSKYIDPKELSDVKSLKQLQRMESKDVKVLDSLKSGAANLQQEIAKSLGDGEQKLYFCSLDKGCFKEVGELQHPSYDGHAFVIEKTADDKFRIYQGYLNQYSLKSFITNELKENTDALRSHTDIHSFLKDMQLLSNAKQWDQNVNEVYKASFGIDHQSFLGEKIPSNFFKLRYSPIKVNQEVYQAPKKEWKLPSLSEKNCRVVTDGAKALAIGASIGGVVSGALYVSSYAIATLFSPLAMFI